ncbi:MAG: DNA-methyltransferase [Promethearchaeota archaeon]
MKKFRTKDNRIVLYQGDCLEVMKKIPDESIDLIITSPPYNVGIKYSKWNDKLSWENYNKFMFNWLTQCYKCLKLDGRIALNIPYEVNYCKRGERILLCSEYYQIMKQVGYNFAGIVDLVENNPHRAKLTAWGSYLSASAPYIYNPKECIILAFKSQWKKKEKGKSYFKNNKKGKKEFQSLVYGLWSYQAETKKWTEANYSLDIPLQSLKILSYKNDLILDPFLGSGTTAVACKNLNRRCIGIEISEEYIKIAIERLGFKTK